MKLNILATTLLLIVVQNSTLRAGGKTGACTPPQGTITISPDQQCDGKHTVAIGKHLDFTATALSDKDCYCGHAVQDSIDPQMGVKWTAGLGTLDGGGMGTPMTWHAPADPHTSIAIRLKLHDSATAEHTTKDAQDGEFLEADSLNIDVVIPDKVTMDVGADQALSCNATMGYSGKSKNLTDNINRNGCTVSFDSLTWFEEANLVSSNDGCALGPGNVGGSTTIGSDNKPYNQVDLFSTGCQVGDFPEGCATINVTQWDVKTPDTDGQYQIMRRKYEFRNNLTAPLDAGHFTLTPTIL